MIDFRPRGPAGQVEVLIVVDCPHITDNKTGVVYTGSLGYELERLLATAGIALSTCRVVSVSKRIPPAHEPENLFGKASSGELYSEFCGRYVHKDVIEGLDDLQNEILRADPRMILALGPLSLWLLTGERSMTQFRGSMLSTGMGLLTIEKTYRVLPTYDMRTLQSQYKLRHVTLHDLRRAAQWRKAEWWPIPEYTFHTSPSCQEVLNFIAELREAKRPFACDIETTGKNISIIGIGNSPDRSMAIPLMTRHNPDGCFYQLDEEHQIIEALRGLMEDKSCGVIGQNFHYDAQFFIRHLGIYPHVVADTMWMQHVCFPGTDKSLDYLASLYCRWYVYWKDELKDYRRLPDDEAKFHNYNCQDVVYTYEVWQNLSQIIPRMRLEEQYNFQMSLWEPLLQMMVNGVRVDLEKRRMLREELEKRREELEKLLIEVVGERVASGPKTALWCRSPTQIKKFFYEECGIKPIIDRKTMRPTVNDEALEKIGNSNIYLWPICQWLKEYASLDTFISTFLEAGVDPDGRMRCFYKGCGAETFRLASAQNVFGSGLNMQNIPRSSIINVRSMFLPDEDHVILDFDLSSADLRVVIAEAGATKLQAVIDRGEDVYGTLASKMDGSPYQGKKHPKRQVMKNVAHALDYVGGVNTISTTYGLPRTQVDATKQWYFKENPEIPGWHRKVEHSLKTTKRITNRFGFTRTYYDRIDQMLAAATAWIGQSTVAITINKGLMNLWTLMPEVKILMQVHDSLVVQIPKRLFTPETVRDIQRCLLIPIQYPGRAPLIIPVECKASEKSWGECENLPLSSVADCLKNATLQIG